MEAWMLLTHTCFGISMSLQLAMYLVFFFFGLYLPHLFLCLSQFLGENLINFLFVGFQYNFEGRYDLVGFIKMVQKAGLYVHLRIGPYICAEWNFG